HRGPGRVQRRAHRDPRRHPDHPIRRLPDPRGLPAHRDRRPRVDLAHPPPARAAGGLVCRRGGPRLRAVTDLRPRPPRPPPPRPPRGGGSPPPPPRGPPPPPPPLSAPPPRAPPLGAAPLTPPPCF